MKLDELQIKKQLSIALENHKNKKFQTAEKLYKEVLTLNKNHLEANFNLGTLYSQLRKFDLALPLLMKAKELNPSNINIDLNIGNLLLDKGDPESSLKYFEKIIQIQPNFVLAHFNKGIIFNNQKKYLDAIRCFEKVIELDPSNLDAYNILGIILQEVGDFKKSLSYLKKSLNITPNNFRAINILLSLLSSIQLSNISENNSYDFNKLFVFLFKKNSIDHNTLFNNVKNLIIFEENKKKIQNHIDLNKSLLSFEVVKKILKKEIFLLTLQKSLFRDKFLEKFLCNIRKEFLLLFKSESEKLIIEFLDFTICFAQQSFLNEYLFFQSSDELKIINELKKKN